MILSDGVDTSEAPPPGLVPAGFTRRFAATLIDMATYCGICALLAYPVSRHLEWRLAIDDPAAFLDAVSNPQLIAHAAGILGLWIALWWCTFTVGWGLAGATLGKFVAGLRIVDHKGRAPIGLSRAFLRLAAYSVSSVTFGMGHLLILLRPDHRALHDLLAGTWVVRRSATKAVEARPTIKDTEAERFIPNS
ncbi:MAG: RDD family protein [Thermoanaerobaculales bacterium]|nr:RDD family protein [Thermoanaerobaculales bacterium]